ncbi:MAG: immune inhibitor A, partial [Candidatus Eremiobacteraeota bacterium]|nr:immune inhibitor A [Candidatus Eremiobacteraeota bacterium]
LGESPDPTYWGETARQLDTHPEWLEALEGLVGQEPAPANLHSGWGLERDPEAGLVWSDSPYSNYADRADNSLELEQISLWGRTQGKLSFEFTTALEKGNDKLLVEAAPHGGQWKTLEQFTGNNPWQRQSIDLSAYDGQKVSLRFRMVSDGSNHYDGIKLNRIQVEANDSRGNPERLYHFEPGSPHVVDLLDALRADRGLKDGAAHLEILKQISQDLGGFSQAVSLWPVVEKSLEHHQGEAALTAVQSLAQRVGVAITGQLAPAVLAQDQINSAMTDRVANLGEAAQGLSLAPELLLWMAGRVVHEPDTAKLGGLLNNLGHDQATEIVTALKAKEKLLDGKVTLAEALGRLAVLRLASENNTPAQLLESLFGELSKTDFERGEDWLQVGGQVVPVRE